MNIEGGKLASVLQTGTPTEGRGQPLIDNGASPEEFADALMGQMESLAEVKVQGQLPGQYKISAMAQHMPPLTGHAELSGIPGDQPLFLLAGKPTGVVQSPVKAADGKGEDSDRADSAVTATASLSLGQGPEKIADSLMHEIIEGTGDQSSRDAPLPETMALPAKSQPQVQWREANNPGHEVDVDMDIKSRMEVSLTDPVDKLRQKIDEALTALGVDGNRVSRPDSENDAEDLAAALSVMNILPPPTAPSAEGTSANPAEDETGHKITPQSFVKPEFEELKPKAPGTTEASEDAPQKKLDFGQLVNESPYQNQNRSERSLQSEGADQGEAKPSAADFDKTLSSGMTDILQANRQRVDGEVEIPPMTKPLAHPNWNEDLGERIVWMRNKELSAAEIRLNPQHLGPISVRIEMNNDQATIVFTSPHAAVRDALEASLPKLREMMSNQQLNLVDVNISQNTSSGQQHQSPHHQTPRSFDGFTLLSGSVDAAGEELENNGAVVGKGILNIYA